MTDKKYGRFILWKEQHETMWQFVMYITLSSLTTIVELGSFAMFNFCIFVSFRDLYFNWWLLDYSVENGGVTGFLATTGSFVVAQIFNFFLHRKTTFKANNSLAKSAIMYSVLVILVFFLQIYLPTLIRVPITHMLGMTIGDLLVKMLSMTATMLIQFSASKWLIMRRT